MVRSNLFNWTLKSITRVCSLLVSRSNIKEMTLTNRLVESEYECQSIVRICLDGIAACDVPADKRL